MYFLILLIAFRRIVMGAVRDAHPVWGEHSETRKATLAMQQEQLGRLGVWAASACLSTQCSSLSGSSRSFSKSPVRPRPLRQGCVLFPGYMALEIREQEPMGPAGYAVPHQLLTESWRRPDRADDSET